MQAAGVVANQVLIMFLLMGVGVLTEKLRMIRYAAASQINNFLLLIVMPCVILNAYQIEFKAELLEGLLLAFLLALFSHAIGIIVSMLLARRRPDAKYRIERFAMVYSNCSFMAIPLLQAVVGSEGVFYGSAYIAVFNLFMWTHGVFLMSGERSMKAVRKALLNPGVLSVAAGLALFFTPFRFPYVVGQVTGYIASLNTPLAMLLTGIFISRSGIKTAFSDQRGAAAADPAAGARRDLGAAGGQHGPHGLHHQCGLPLCGLVQHVCAAVQAGRVLQLQDDHGVHAALGAHAAAADPAGGAGVGESVYFLGGCKVMFTAPGASPEKQAAPAGRQAEGFR